jgi:hypothetical protein
MRTPLPRRSLLAGLALVAVLTAGPAQAEITVTGAIADFVALLNSLIKGTTVSADGTGKLSMAGTPTNEFGKRLKMIIDSAHKVKIKAVKDGVGVFVGRFDGNGEQTVDLDDIPSFADPGNMLPTKGSGVMHEIEEVFDSVKDGKTKPPANDGGTDFEANHEGSAKTGEDAVNKEEAGITRTDEGTAGPAAKQDDGSSKFKVKRKFKKDGNEILVDHFLTFTKDGKQKHDSVKLEVKGPVKGGFFVIEEEPGVRSFDTDFHPTGFLTLDRPGYLEIDFFGRLYVAEQDLDKILVFDSNLQPLFEITHPLLDNPQGIAVSPLQERIFVGSGNQILRFDLTGGFLGTISDPQLQSVRGLEVDRQGFVYASSFDRDLVLVFDPLTGARVASRGHATLDGPEGLAIDQIGNLWVASFNNDRILQIEPDGDLAATLSASNLDGPRGLGLTPQSFVVPALVPGGLGLLPETLLVSSYNNDLVLELDLETGDVVASAEVKTPVGTGQLETLEEDLEAPFCALTSSSASGILVTLRDQGSGLASISVIESVNASVAVPPFEPGTLDPVQVTATKLNMAQRSRVMLEARDVAGNVTRCDPVLMLVLRGTGKPVTETVTQVPAAERYVTILNGTPGLKNLLVIVNGLRFRVAGLGDGQTRTLDVAAAMRPGDDNVIELQAHGKPGSQGTVVIHD